MATVHVGNFFSRCGACGGNADPTEPAHIHGGRGSAHKRENWLSETNGCQAIFDRIDDPRRIFAPQGGGR